MSVTPAPTPTNRELRIRLGQKLCTSEELDAFCVDCFPRVAARFATGMERVARENLLLQMSEPAELATALQSYSPRALGRPNLPARRVGSWIKVALAATLALAVTLVLVLLAWWLRPGPMVRESTPLPAPTVAAPSPAVPTLPPSTTATVRTAEGERSVSLPAASPGAVINQGNIKTGDGSPVHIGNTIQVHSSPSGTKRKSP